VTSLRRPLAGLAAADIISTMGSEMSAVALPWFVLVTTGSPTRMGAVLAAEFVGMTVLGLWGGRVAGAVGPRRMMLGSDVLRFGLVLLVPILYWAGGLTFPLLLAVGFVVGGFFPAYSSSKQLVLAGLVADDELRLTRVGGLIGSVNETASFVGPALGGVLVVWLGPVRVLVVDAVSYLAAFALVATLVPALPRPSTSDDENRGVMAGLRYLWHNHRLRGQVAGLGLVEVGWAAMMATLPVLALHDGGASVAGWLIGSYGAGSVVGGLISSRARRTGGRVTAWAVAGTAASLWALLLPVPVWTLAMAVAANGVCSGLFFPRFFSSVTTTTPPELRARVMTAVMIAMSAPGPVGFLGAGFLAQRTGSTTASLLLVAVSATLGAAVTVRALLRPGSPTTVADPAVTQSAM
jgi:MFS family permease